MKNAPGGALVCALIFAACMPCLAVAQVMAPGAVPGITMAQAVAPSLGEGPVHVPYGDWVADLALSMLGLSSVAVSWLFRHAPNWMKTMKVDQALDRAVQFGLNAVANAAKGKALDLNTGNQVANMALDYVASHVPSLVKEFGLTNLREKIYARLTLDDTAELNEPAAPAKS